MLRLSKLPVIATVLLGVLVATADARSEGLSRGSAARDRVVGVSVRLNHDYSPWMKNRLPGLNMVSVGLEWRSIQPRQGVFEWGSLDASLRDARDRDYTLIVRILAGFRAPAWLYTDARHPVERVRGIPTDDGWSSDHDIVFPKPWDADLAFHYRRLIRGLQAKLAGSDGQGGRWADHVLFVPVSMPTEQGSEMPIGFGRGEWTGTYRGVTTTWDRWQTNRAMWLAEAPAGATDAERLAALQSAMRRAWGRAIEIHMQELTAAPSSVAFGFVFADGYRAAQSIAETEFARYPRRLYAMTTNLQPKVLADGTLRPWWEWSPPGDRALRTAVANGARMGFQTERGVVMSSDARVRDAVNTALRRYPLRFIESSRPIITRSLPFFLTGSRNVQQRLADRFTA